jgi:hypothetical protein
MDFEAYAEKANWITSSVVTANYTVTGTVADPTFTPVSGLYTEPLDVVIEVLSDQESTVSNQIGKSSRSYITNRHSISDYRSREGEVIKYRTATNGGAWSDWMVFTTPITVPLNTTMDFEAYAEKPNWITSSIVSATYTITGTVVTPHFSPAGGIYLEQQNVSISTETTGATIEYSFDNEEWVIGNLAIVSYSTTLYARAYLENWLNSDVAEEMYFILNPPQNLIAEGLAGYIHLSWQAPYSGEEMITMPRKQITGKRSISKQNRTRSRDSDELIGYNVYRLVGTDFVLLNQEPITQTEYDDIDLSAGEYTYQVTALYDEGESNPSNSASAHVNMVATPDFHPEPGYFEIEVELTITCTTEDVDIYYTLDGSEPMQTSLLYSEPVILDSTVYVNARAFRNNWLPSEIAEGYYEIVLTGIHKEVVSPVETKLLPAYPNPFNPTTTICFDIKENEKGTLTIFNLRGQRIISESFEAGHHSYLWNGERCSSGLYFYQLITDEKIITRKMVMVK